MQEREIEENESESPENGLRAPSSWLLALEGRALWELGWFWQSAPLFSLVARGDGHPVLVLPGFTASDMSTAPLRRLLGARGYQAHGWNQGRNLGLRPGLDLRMARRLRALHWRYGCKVSLVGWSLGGIYARELARQHPDQVRQVITLGSPFNLSSKANHAWRLYELLSGIPVEEEEELLERLREPLPVPTTAVYSRTDGVVAWQCCLEDESRPQVENIEVPGSHCGLGFNPLVAWVILDRLAQPEGFWRPFDRRGVRKLFYRRATPGPWQALTAEG